MTGKWDFKAKISSEILPSLLTTFYLTNDSKLEDNLLEIILKLFSQTVSLFNNLEQLEILFDSEDILPYKVRFNFI